MKNYKAIIFDLDDTLILEDDYVKSGFNEVAKVISTKYQLNFLEVINTMNHLYSIGNKRIFNTVLELSEINYDEELIKELINIYRNHYPKINLLEEAKDTIDWLKEKEYKLGIITDGYKETQIQKIKKLNLCEVFDNIIVTDLLGKEFWKPHKLSYKLMKRNLSIKYTEMIYIGDNEKKDFITANQLGITTVKIKRVGGVYNDICMPKEYKAKYEIEKLEELKCIIEIGENNV